MAKRFTESTKWNGWFRMLKPCNKLLWLYILDNCDIAGVWKVDKALADFSIGCQVNWEDVATNFTDHIYEFDGGKKWYILDFVSFQNGDELNTKSPVHKKIISTLSAHGLAPLFLDENNRLLNRVPNTLSNGVHSTPVVEVKVEVEEIVEGKVEVEVVTASEKKNEVKEEVIMPYGSETFKNLWATWIEYRKEIKKPYKSDKSEQAALKQLSQYDEGFSIKLIETAIANGYQGLVFSNTYEEFLKYQKNAGQSKFTKQTGSSNPAGVYEMYRNESGK